MAQSHECAKNRARMEVNMKIYIIGNSGTGKTFLANRLSEKRNVLHYDLDDLQWDNTANIYGVKTSPEKRNALLQEILTNEDWIIEGIYYKWCMQCFEDADKIYVLEMPGYLCRYRIIKRFIQRKLGIQKGKKETLKSLRDLLKWTDKFQTINLQEIKNILNDYSNKVVFIHSSKEVNELLK